MNTQTFQIILFGELAKTDALLAETPYEQNPDDFKIFLGRRSMLVDLLALSDPLAEREKNNVVPIMPNNSNCLMEEEDQACDVRWN